MCNGTVTSAIGIARVLIAAGVFMLIQMAIGIDVCCYRACNINKQKPLFPTRASPLSTLHPTHRPGRPPRVEGRRSQGLRGGGIQRAHHTRAHGARGGGARRRCARARACRRRAPRARARCARRARA
jgi:hypothetical protein